MVLTLQANESPQNAICSNPKPTRRKTLEEVFNQLDEDSTGSISPAEIKRGFQKLCRIKVSDKVIEDIMKKTDLDGNGTIELDELEFLMETYEIEKSFNLRGDVKQQQKPVVETFDKSHSSPAPCTKTLADIEAEHDKRHNPEPEIEPPTRKVMTDIELEHEKRLAELEQQMRYWKAKAESVN